MGGLRADAFIPKASPGLYRHIAIGTGVGLVFAIAWALPAKSRHSETIRYKQKLLKEMLDAQKALVVPEAEFPFAQAEGEAELA